MMSSDAVMTSPIPNASPSKGKILVATLLALSIAAVFYFDLWRYLSFDVVKDNRDRLLAFTDTHYAAAVTLFILSYCVVVGLSLPGGAVLTLSGGFLFGSVMGTLFVNIGATTGATVAFLTARYLLRDWVERKFGDRLEPFQEGFARNAFSYLMFVRLNPLFPFFLVNMASGLTRVSTGTYIAATAVGIVPVSFVYAYAGRQLGMINSPKEILSMNVIGALVLLAMTALVPIVYRRLAVGRRPLPEKMESL
jgi:uncharacterized membrane protein YdjX (TVP38/TMEM64 family)